MEPVSEEEEAVTKSRKARSPRGERRVFLYQNRDGEKRDCGSFKESTFGTPLERGVAAFARDMFGPGNYEGRVHKPNGQFDRFFDFSIAASEPERERIIDIEPEEYDDDEPEVLSVPDNHGQMTTVEVENLLLKERLNRLETETSRQKNGTQSEMQTLISALEESRREQRELMMLMITQAQKPQQDATAQAMNILEKSFGFVTKARAISEEIAPQQETGSSESFMGGAARLIDSVGKNAGTFAPLIMGMFGGSNRPAAAPKPPVNSSIEQPTTNGNGNAGELADLAKTIQKKNAVKDTEKEETKK